MLTSDSALCAEKQEPLDMYIVKAVKSGIYFYFICRKSKGLKKRSLKLCMTAYHEHHCYPVRENRVTLIPREEYKNWTDSHLNYMA